MKLVFFDRMDNDGRGALAVFDRYAKDEKLLYAPIGLDRDMNNKDGKHYINVLLDYIGNNPKVTEVIFMDLAPRTLLECQAVWNILEPLAISLKIIDHHNLPYFVSDISEGITYVYEKGVSACMLTWKHYFPNMKAPYVVELINDRDVWINKLQPDTNYFYNTFGMMNQTELNNLVVTVSEIDLNSWLAIGKIREESTIKPTIQGLVNSCEVVEWNGYKIAVPMKDISPEYVSEVGNKACKQYECDFFCTMFQKGNSWGYGLRSLNGEALKFIRDNNFKGGGHPNACGFTHDKRLF